jgi:hypothetical protein
MPKTKQKKKSVRKKRSNRKGLNTAAEAVSDNPTLKNAQAYADVRRKKGTEARRKELER